MRERIEMWKKIHLNNPRYDRKRNDTEYKKHKVYWECEKMRSYWRPKVIPLFHVWKVVIVQIIGVSSTMHTIYWMTMDSCLPLSHTTFFITLLVVIICKYHAIPDDIANTILNIKHFLMMPSFTSGSWFTLKMLIQNLSIYDVYEWRFIVDI